MMNSHEVVCVDLDAHFDAKVFHIVDVPSRCVADHFAVRWLDKLRTIPKSFGQWCKAERRKEALADFHHIFFCLAAACSEICNIGLLIPLRYQKRTNVIPDVAGTWRSNDVIDIAPFLRPHISEQIGTDWSCFGLDRIAIFLVQLRANIGMQLVVQRLYLKP